MNQGHDDMSRSVDLKKVRMLLATLRLGGRTFAAFRQDPGEHGGDPAQQGLEPIIRVANVPAQHRVDSSAGSDRR